MINRLDSVLVPSPGAELHMTFCFQLVDPDPAELMFDPLFELMEGSKNTAFQILLFGCIGTHGS